MKFSGNVIDLRSKFKNKASSSSVGNATVTDITDLRQEKIRDERRRVKRTLLTEFIGANVVVPDQGLMRVAICDISKEGMAFDMQMERGHFEKDEILAMRVYMNHKTYFPFVVRVTYFTWIEDESVFRVGTKFEKETVNREALFHFVKFIETVSASLKQDDGDVMVSHIK